MIHANLYGILFESYDRPAELQSVSTTIAEIDAAWEQHRDDRSDTPKAFLQAATRHYAKAIEYNWPKHEARVAFTDNWILYLMGYLDEPLRRAGLTNVEGLFLAYESIDYRRALARGYGICSQNALGLASLLERRYGIDADVIGLDGHVVVEAEGFLLDPSVGLMLPFSLSEAERREAGTAAISAIYEAAFGPDQVIKVFGFDGQVEKITPYAELGQFYDAEGNQRIDGVKGYRPKLYWLERASEWLKWFAPIFFVLVGVLGLHSGRYSRKRATPA